MTCSRTKPQPTTGQISYAFGMNPLSVVWTGAGTNSAARTDILFFFVTEKAKVGFTPGERSGLPHPKHRGTARRTPRRGMFAILALSAKEYHQLVHLDPLDKGAPPGVPWPRPALPGRGAFAHPARDALCARPVTLLPRRASMIVCVPACLTRGCVVSVGRGGATIQRGQARRRPRRDL